MGDSATIPTRPALKPGVMVVMMGGGYEVPERYQGQVWVVDSEPWTLGDGTEVVKLRGYEGGYATDGLVPIIFPERDA